MLEVLVLFGLLGVALGIVVARSKAAHNYYKMVLKPLWDALMASAISAKSFREFVHTVWDRGQLLAIAMYKDEKGALGVVAMVITVIVAAIAILIGIIVYANVSSSMPTQNLSNETQQMITNLNTNVNSAFTLLAVGIIVLASSFILTVLIVSLGRAAQ